jgi:glycosyltransferase involved in cell wall biosynthesis
VLALPGDPATLSGGYGYCRRLVHGLRALGREVTVLRLPDGFPDPSAEALATAYGWLGAQPPGVPLMVDGLALGVMPAVAEAIGSARPLVALVHHPLALETGLGPARAAALRASERAALAAARRVIVTSRTTAATLVADYGVSAARIVVALPGTDPVRGGAGRPRAADAPHTGTAAGGTADPRAAATSAGRAVRLLSVGALVPRKGHDRLLEALGALLAWPWTLTVIGDAERDPAHARALRAQVAMLGLADRVRFAGGVDAAQLEAAWQRADVFVLASRHEGYGMAYAEALAQGLPVIAPRVGAIPEVVPPEAAWLVPPDDVQALRAALHEAVADPAARARRAAGACAAAGSLPRWDTAIAAVEAALVALA